MDRLEFRKRIYKSFPNKRINFSCRNGVNSVMIGGLTITNRIDDNKIYVSGAFIKRFRDEKMEQLEI